MPKYFSVNPLSKGFPEIFVKAY